MTGYGSLGLSVEGAHRSDLEMKSKSATEYTLQYKPHEPGVYLLNIKFADDHVAGTPIYLEYLLIVYLLNIKFADKHVRGTPTGSTL